MAMITAIKFYSEEGYTKRVDAICYWTPEFLAYVVRKIGGIEETFTSRQLEDIFERFISRNATRKKLKRLYNIGIFKRELRF